MDELSVVVRARRLIENVASAPVDVRALADTHEMVVRESADLEAGEAGRTWRVGGKTYIVVNKLDDPFRQRFTILHELAHHVLKLPSRHGETIPSSELERFVGRPLEEKLCDVFAAACLVPSHLIRPMTEVQEFSAATVRGLSDAFEASKPCVASSFVRSSSRPLAYVFAEAGRIQYVITSAALRAHRIYVDTAKLPRNSAAGKALAQGSTTEIADLDGTDWSASDAANSFVVHEEAICLRGWKQTISLLTFEHVGGPSKERDSQEEDDELLPELTGILPWPKR